MRGELKQLLSDEDERWYSFGFGRPLDPTTPAVVRRVIFTAGTPKSFFTDFDDAKSADSYRVRVLDTGVTPPKEIAQKIVDESEATFNDIPSGTHVEIIVTARNDSGGESGPSEPATAVVPYTILRVIPRGRVVAYGMPPPAAWDHQRAVFFGFCLDLTARFFSLGWEGSKTKRASIAVAVRSRVVEVSLPVIALRISSSRKRMALEVLIQSCSMGRNWLRVLLLCVCLTSALAAEYEFRYDAPQAQSVELMSDFNGWKGVPMKKAGDGVWSAKVSLSPGTHAYKFLVDGKDWVFDPKNPERKTADGVENSAVTIGSESAVATPSRSASTPARVESTPATSVTPTSDSSSKTELAVTPGEVVTTEVAMSAKRRGEALRECNEKLEHTRIGIAVPTGFDPQKSWPVLVVNNTQGYANIDSLRQFKDAANGEGWIVLAADGVEAKKDNEGSCRSACIGAAFDYLTNIWPVAKDWPVAVGGMSGGAKNSAFAAADLGREHHRIIGMLMMGCNQDMATTAMRKAAPPPSFQQTPVFLSSGKSDMIAKPQMVENVRASLKGGGFYKVRLESFDGGTRHLPAAHRRSIALVHRAIASLDDRASIAQPGVGFREVLS